MKNLFLTIVLSFIATFVLAQDTLTLTLQFGYNSTIPSLDYSEELASLSETSIISIAGYASPEGNVDRNYKLSADRALAVYNLLLANAESFDFESEDVYGKGPTSAFGQSAYENRIVVITYVASQTYYHNLKRFDMLDIMPVGKGLFSNEMYMDTIEVVGERLQLEDTTFAILNEPIVLETIIPTIENNTALKVDTITKDTTNYRIVSTVKADGIYKKAGLSANESKDMIMNAQFFINPVTKEHEQLDSTQIGIKILPVEKAVRHYMKKGMSRQEAENIVYSRDTYFHMKTGEWHKINLEPKSKIKSDKKSKNDKKAKSKKTKVRLKKTKGLSARGGVLNKLFPYRHC